jgi:hypothetical protein
MAEFNKKGMRNWQTQLQMGISAEEACELISRFSSLITSQRLGSFSKFQPLAVTAAIVFGLACGADRLEHRH